MIHIKYKAKNSITIYFPMCFITSIYTNTLILEALIVRSQISFGNWTVLTRAHQL